MARSPWRWDPEWQAAGDAIDDVFDHLLGFTAGSRYGLQHSWRPAVDVFAEGDGIAVVAEVPGVDEADLQVSVAAQRLRIAGIRRPSQRPEADPQRLEIEYGPFERVIALPADSDGEHITAQLRHGLLTVHVPRRPRARQVTVRAMPEGDGTE
jgi:HSP20 family protein